MKGFLPAALAIVGTSVLYMYSGYDDATGLRASSFPSRQLRLNPSFTDPKNVMVKPEMDPSFISHITPEDHWSRLSRKRWQLLLLPKEHSICGHYDSLPYQHGQCPEITKDKPIVLLSEATAYGRTGNNLMEFLNALQLARDQNAQLGLMANAWPFKVITRMWFPIGDGEVDLASWESTFEEAFCVKIFPILSNPMGDGWDVIQRKPKDLLHYKIEAPLSEYVANSEYDIRTLFRHINRGVGHASDNQPVQDMCAVITSIFGKDQASAIYSVIHSRSFAQEGPGKGRNHGQSALLNLSKVSGVDPLGALELRPDYIKSILEPLGMLDYPIAYITDGQDPQIIERLMADPDIGPMIRLVPKEESWLGGDITLAVMSNVFIGNPVSTFSSFIAKCRLALGFEHNYLFRAKDENGQWRTVCGDQGVYGCTQ